MFDFNISEYYEDRSVLPAGQYNTQIVEAEIKPTKKTEQGLDTSQYLYLKHAILDGPHQGKFIFNRMNVYHSSSVACEIGRKQLASLCKAINKLDAKHVSDLLQCRPTVLMETKEDERYGKSSYVKAYVDNVAPKPLTTSHPAVEEVAYNDPADTLPF